MRARLLRYLFGVSAATAFIYGALLVLSNQYNHQLQVFVSERSSTVHNGSWYEHFSEAYGENTRHTSTMINAKEEYRVNPKERHHVALLKVHKTGSSTIQNIFLRFADSRNLTLIMAHDNKSLSENGFANVISYQNSLEDTNVVPPPEGRHFDMLCCHVIYNRTQFSKYLPNDTVYIGIVRDPISRTESAIRYFHMLEGIPLSVFAADPLKQSDRPGSMALNRMAFEFNFPRELFPKRDTIYTNDTALQRQIDDYLLKLNEEFQLILINEYMAESLVLMKRLLNWQLKDIIYMDLNVAKKESRKFSDTDRIKLEQFLYLDVALYNFAVKQFKKKVDKLGDGFDEEVKHFLHVKELVNGFCGVAGESFTVDESRWNSRFTVSSEDCELYKIFETKYIQKLRRKQYGTVNI